MISVTVQRDGRGFISSFMIEGHSGYAEIGQDIVCAAVSAVSQTALLGLQEVLRQNPVVCKDEGRLAVSVQDAQAAATVLETMLLGLKDIAGGYPEYVEVKDKGPKAYSRG